MERRLPVLRLYLTTKVNRPTCTGTVLVSNVRHLPMLLLEKKESSCASVIFFPHDASNEVRAVNRERPDPRPLRSRDCRPISGDVQVEFGTTAGEKVIIVAILVRFVCCFFQQTASMSMRVSASVQGRSHTGGIVDSAQQQGTLLPQPPCSCATLVARSLRCVRHGHSDVPNGFAMLPTMLLCEMVLVRNNSRHHVLFPAFAGWLGLQATPGVAL